MKIVKSTLLTSMLLMTCFLALSYVYRPANVLTVPELLQNNIIISTVPSNAAADTTKMKNEKFKQRKMWKKRKAEEKALANKREKANDYIALIRQADKKKYLQEADKYFEIYLEKITKKRKEFINQLNANPFSLLIDQPEEEILKNEATLKIGMAKN